MKVLITGANGFLGSHLVKHFKRYTLYTPTRKEVDLRLKENCKKVVKGMDAVIHLAANVGGIGYNQQHPAELFYDNLIMSTNLMHEAYLAGVKKYVALGTICAYPKYTPVPFKEKDLWMGYPEETNAPYGLAKKMQLVQAQAYRDQYNFNVIFLLPVNLYGPRDNFDPESSHVIPALIRKFVEAKRLNLDKVEVWGTGKATREFLYVKDAARGIYLAFKKYNGKEPVNLGSGHEISIKKLVEKIKRLTDYKGEVVYNTSKPDGQPRRCLDTSKAKEFGFVAKTPFDKGLKETIKYFKNL